MAVKLKKDKADVDLDALTENDFKDIAAIYNIIQSYTKALNSQKQALSAVLSYLRHFEKNSDPRADTALAKLYCAKIQELSPPINSERAKNILSDKEKKVFVPWADILILRKQLEIEYKLEDALFLALYMDLPAPRRVQDFCEMIYVKSEPAALADINYYVEDTRLFIFRKYKTYRTYGEQRLQIPISLQALLDSYIDQHKCSLGQSLFNKSETLFSRKIRNIFSVNVAKQTSVDTIRHAFLTNFEATNPSMEDRQRMSRLMGHSLSEQLYYDKSHDTFIKKNIHTELVKSDEPIPEEHTQEIAPLQEIVPQEEIKPVVRNIEKQCINEEENNTKARDHYRSSIDYQIIQRLHSEINNHLPNNNLEVEELLNCSRSFYIQWIKHLLGNKKFEEYDLSHVQPVNSFKDQSLAFTWKNYNILKASENRSQKDTVDKNAEAKQLKLVNQYLEEIVFKE